MANSQFLEYLFRSHLADLKNVVYKIVDSQGHTHGVENLFICPICLEHFHFEDICNKRLSEGHIWPRGIRQKSNSGAAKGHRVLLCTSCNSKSGDHGDVQMQLLESVREGEETGDTYGERRIRIQHGLRQPIELNARIQLKKQDMVRGQLLFAPSRNDPKEQKRLRALLKKDESFSVSVHPYHRLNPSVARAGWGTAAYLLAFYALGYRYVLQDSLNPIREYIARSFEVSGKGELESPRLGGLDVRMCDKCYYEDPEISLVIPVDGKNQAHLQVSFLSYHVDLPFHCVTSVLESLIYLQSPDIDQQVPRMVDLGQALHIPIKCTKLDGHECLWDYVLGKPLVA